MPFGNNQISLGSGWYNTSHTIGQTEPGGSGGGATLNQGAGNAPGGVGGSSVGVINQIGNSTIQRYNRTQNDPFVIRYLRTAQSGQPPQMPEPAEPQQFHGILGLFPVDLYQKCLPGTSQCTDQGRNLFPVLEKSGGPVIAERGYGNGRGYVGDIAFRWSDVKDPIPFPNPQRAWRAAPVYPAVDTSHLYGDKGLLTWTR